MAASLLLSVAGLVTLVVGAEALVRGASRLAIAIGISPLVVGLTVVAFGTSSPELTVSLQATLSGEPDVALGNVVGSNIFNVLFILGVSAAITPLVVAQRLVRVEVPLMIAVCTLLFVFAVDGTIGRMEGLALVGGIVAYVVLVIAASRSETTEVRAEYEAEIDHRIQRPASIASNLGRIGVGLACLIVGSHWFVEGAVAIASTLGISSLVIALTVVAAGTSAPEAATSIVASLRGERDIAVGNVVGSNLFNILGIAGLASLISPDGIRVAPAALRFDIPVMIAASVACLPIFFTGYRIARWEGFLFLAYFLAYTAYLILDSAGHDALPAFSRVMGLFVLPITIVTLAVFVARALRGRNEA